MEDHEMWWRLRRLLFTQSLSFAESDVIQTWVQGFPKVLRVLKSKPWEPESRVVIDAFEDWYNRWWESGIFEQPKG